MEIFAEIFAARNPVKSRLSSLLANRQTKKSLYIYKIVYMARINTHIYTRIHIYRDYIGEIFACLPQKKRSGK